MFSRPKILFLVSLLFVALLNPKFNPYLLFKFLIFYHSSGILKDFILPIVLSTWIRTDAIFLPSLISSAGSCLRPSINGGMLSLTPMSFNISLIVKPLSAITDIPGLSSR